MILSMAFLTNPPKPHIITP